MAEFAVLIPYVATEYGDALLLEVRSEKVKQPGEICFPGGRVEPGETLVMTAVREACEELGLRPEEIVITEEPELNLTTDGIKVWSVAARLDASVMQRIRLSEDEVAEVFLLPLRWIIDNPSVHYDFGTTSDEEMPPALLGYLANYGDYRKYGDTDYWEYDGHGIWGLTARMIIKIRNAELRGLNEVSNSNELGGTVRKYILSKENKEVDLL